MGKLKGMEGWIEIVINTQKGTIAAMIEHILHSRNIYIVTPSEPEQAPWLIDNKVYK